MLPSKAHFTGGDYILLRGCWLRLFFARAVEGLEVEQTVVKHPRFWYVGNKRHNTSEAGCSQK